MSQSSDELGAKPKIISDRRIALDMAEKRRNEEEDEISQRNAEAVNDKITQLQKETYQGEELIRMMRILGTEISNMKTQFEIQQQQMQRMMQQASPSPMRLPMPTPSKEYIQKLLNLPPKPNISFNTQQHLPTEMRNDSPTNIRTNSTPVNTQTPLLISRRASLRDALDTIPRFDGRNISVFQFSKCCRRARDMLSPDCERDLVTAIIARLERDAMTAIGNRRMDTVEDLIEQLKKMLSPAKDASSYRTELCKLYMRHENDLLNYASRVRDLKEAIFDEEIKDPYFLIDDHSLGRLDREAMNSFKQGLMPEIINRMGDTQFNDLEEMIEKANEINNALKQEKIRRGQFNNQHNNRNNGRNSNDSGNSNSDGRNTNSWPSPNRVNNDNRNNANGYNNGSSWKANPNYQRNNNGRNTNGNRDNRINNNKSGNQNYQGYSNSRNYNTQFNNRDRNNTNKFCEFCQIPGHEINQCRSLARAKDFVARNSGNETEGRLNVDANRSSLPQSRPTMPVTIMEEPTEQSAN